EPISEAEPEQPGIERWKWVAGIAFALPVLAAILVGLMKTWTVGEAYAPVQRVTKPVLELRLSDMKMQYWIDRHGAIQTGVAVVQLPLEPGEHKVWFALGD